MAVLAAALSGCTTFPNQRRMAAAREEIDVDTVKSELKRLRERVDGMETVQQRILNELETLRSSSDRGKQDVSGRVAALEQAVKAVDASREADKQEILKFMQSLAASPGAGAGSGSGSAVNVSKTGEHVVQPGETLSKIAAAYKTTVEAIAKANNLTDGNVLRVEQKLAIPGAGAGKSPVTAGREPR